MARRSKIGREGRRDAPYVKLVIQIPCYNEEDTLAEVLASLPRELPGFDAVEWLVVDDGSDDETSRVAREGGVDHLLRHGRNLGLARAFQTALEGSLAAGADVIVNTDGDGQYDSMDLPELVAPILDGSADMVVGARPIDEIRHFSLVKKLLQHLGSWAVRVASGTEVRDAPSGYRAFSRRCARRIVVFDDYTYTLETLFQAGRSGMGVRSVPVSVNHPTRPSRLQRSMVGYVSRSVLTILRSFVSYRSFETFALPGGLSFLLGLALGLLCLFQAFGGGLQGRLGSLVLAALLVGTGLQLVALGFVAEQLSANRRLVESLREARWAREGEEDRLDP